MAPLPLSLSLCLSVIELEIMQDRRGIMQDGRGNDARE